jgi:hypothetical protein
LVSAYFASAWWVSDPQALLVFRQVRMKAVNAATWHPHGVGAKAFEEKKA